MYHRCYPSVASPYLNMVSAAQWLWRLVASLARRIQVFEPTNPCGHM